MAGRLRRPIIIIVIIIIMLSISPEKGILGAHKKTVGHYLCDLHGGYAPAARWEIGPGSQVTNSRYAEWM